MNQEFSIIILTFNEEVHLPRLLNSARKLNAALFILDSGSTDNTTSIANQFNANILMNKFENHPKQWDFALKNFKIETPWVICLDADQVLSPELIRKLNNFKDSDNLDINGIYFNRKNYFKGKWIRHGGYFPFYLLKMIRCGTGYSDLNENMDHRFIVNGKTEIWKDGYLVEENLKENAISFWITKHNRYSDLVAQEEIERMMNLRIQTLSSNFWGSPDERTARLKQIWWRMPRYSRPAIYFLYRFFFKLGFLDGKEGIIFHFLQAFWFRLIVDIKMDEIIKDDPYNKQYYNLNLSPVKFIFSFLFLFLLFYYFNIMFFGLTSPGGIYIPFLAEHLNYIQGLRWILLNMSMGLLNLLGFSAICNNYDLLVAGHGSIQVVYSCLGLGVSSFFAAFVLAYPKPLMSKLTFVIIGIMIIEILNVIRFALLALYWTKKNSQIIDHHTIFNLIIYLFIAVSLYFWVKSEDNDNLYAANKTV